MDMARSGTVFLLTAALIAAVVGPVPLAAANHAVPPVCEVIIDDPDLQTEVCPLETLVPLTGAGPPGVANPGPAIYIGSVQVFILGEWREIDAAVAYERAGHDDICDPWEFVGFDCGVLGQIEHHEPEPFSSPELCLVAAEISGHVTVAGITHSYSGVPAGWVTHPPCG